MPNWVTNRVRFSDRGKEILDKVITKVDDEYYTERFDFEKIIPMPKELHLTNGGIQNESILYALSLKTDEEREKIYKILKETKTSFYGNYYNKFFNNIKNIGNKKKLKQLAKEFKEDRKNNKKYEYDSVDYNGLGIKTLEDLGNRHIQNIIDYGSDNWYDWSCANWGTKWNSYSTYIIDDNNVEFDTAWACPFEVLQELSKQYSDIEIYVEYADEDIGSNCGYFTLKNGDIINGCDMSGDIEFAMEIKGYDEEIKEEIRNYNNEEE